MSDAIEFGIGGNNKGFVGVLNDTEQRAKETVKRVNSELDKAGANGIKGKQKIGADLNGLAGDFAKVTSASSAAELAFSKIGASLKAAGAVSLVLALGKGIYDATAKATELDLAMQRIGRSNAGGAVNFGLSQLEGNLATIQQARSENQKIMTGEGSNWFKTMGGEFERALARTGKAFTGEGSASVKTPEQREKMLRDAEEAALARIAEKQREIWKIESERIGGNKEAADIMAIEASYAERIQEAIRVRNVELQKQLGLERDSLIGSVRRQAGVALGERTTTEAVAAMRSGDARRAVRMSAEAEQRQANETNLAAAQFAEMDAKKALKARPNDPDLQTRYNVAVRETERITSENAKWERDIARSKEDSVKTQRAANEATTAELQGQSHIARLAQQRVSNELAITKAKRDGNEELAKELQIAGDLERKQLMRQRVMDGGRVMGIGEVRARERQAEIDARIADRAAERLERGDGRTRGSAGRAPRASRISGARYEQDSGDTRLGKPIGSTNFEEELAPRGLDSMRENAQREMENKKKVSDIGMTRAERQDAINKMTEEKIQTGKASPEEALASMAQILKSWDSRS